MPGDESSTSRKRQRDHPLERPAYPRKRAARACSTCRRRRTKCDNEQPACSSCVSLGIECIYEDGGNSTFDLASIAILQRLDGLETLLRAVYTSTPAARQREDATSPSVTLENVDSLTVSRTIPLVPYYINIETVLSWPVFQTQDFNPQIDLKTLLHANNPRIDPPPLSLATDFEANGAGELLQHFFDKVHIYNPVLDEEKVREYMRDAGLNGLGWDAKSCLLLLVYAIGSIASLTEATPSENSSSSRQSPVFQQAEAFFFAAQKRMGILLCKSGILEAQCFFLAGVYLMTTFRIVEAWKVFVQALACCQGLPNPKYINETQYEDESQLQQSIYWTCFKSELELRLELNIAKNSVWDLTYPSYFPPAPKSLQTRGEVIWYFYLSEIALRRLGNRILTYIYQNQSPRSTHQISNTILEFEEQAEAWSDSLPQPLKLNISADETNDEHAALRFVLNGHLIDCYEMMYWPFIVESIYGRVDNDATSNFFLKKGLELCVRRIEENESGFKHRHHGTWLMLRSCTRSTLVLLSAARSKNLTSFLPRGWESEVRKVIEMLRHWKDEAMDAGDRLLILEEMMKDIDSFSQLENL